MKRYFKYIMLFGTFIVILSTLTMCREAKGPFPFIVNNNTDDTVYFSYEGYWRDTFIVCNRHIHLIPPYSHTTLWCDWTWESEFGNQKDYILQIFILDKRVYPYFRSNCDSLRYNNSFLLKRYEYTVNEMTKMNWTITYP
ncbi:hypothetical protein D0T53_01945 [Dysgonomonas sp. 216]|uniref:hypothetical protein n=1 Tax=Dysgonomonas sp. 216 TaxID=2302934 RepID=UPI0013D68548|nr:hypothetical protein [Dysgonomonas sp. 216]NDW17677.1 hypothetical protein [Dysgonomonas sp. 216]